VEQRVAQALERNIARDGSDAAKVVQELPNLSPETLPFMAAGRNLQSMGEVVAKSPGPAQEVMVAAAQRAQNEIRSGIKDDIGRTLGGRGDYLDTLEDAVARRRDEAAEKMASIGAASVRMDPNAVQALRSDMANAKVRQIAQARLASTDPAEREVGATLNRLADQVLDDPGNVVIDVRAAQDISYLLKKAADGAYRGDDAINGEALAGLSKAIRGSARASVKDYDTWLRKYGDDSEHIEALQVGRGVLGGDGKEYANTAAALAKTYQGYSETGRDMFRKGVGEALLAEVRKTGGGVAAMRKLVKGEEFRDRVRIAFPTQQSYDDFINAATKRVRADNAYQKIQEGSPTYPLQAARRDLEADPVGGAIDAVGDVRGALKNALRNRVPNRSLIEGAESNQLLGRALSDGGEMLRLLQQLQAQRIAAQGRQGRVNKVGGYLVTPAEIARERAMSGAR
jgi:hypothetical protein